MTKHAPAPWTWDGKYPARILDADGYVVCDFMPSGTANIHLVKAVPELLKTMEALEAFLDVLVKHPFTGFEDIRKDYGKREVKVLYVAISRAKRQIDPGASQ